MKKENNLTETGSRNYKLFKHLRDEHYLLLTESDLSDITNICEKEIDWEEMERNFLIELSYNLRNGANHEQIFGWLKSEIKEYLS